MPSFADWLTGSWEFFRRRWATLMAVAGAGGAAVLAAAFLPLVPAGAATLFGAGPAWAVWGLAALSSMLIALWLSTWAQASLALAALTEEPVGACLSQGWKHTGPFGWVLTLVLLASVGGYYLFILPGLALTVLLIFAPFYQLGGEAEGTRALALSWARVKPRFWTVAGRLAAAWLAVALPGQVPYVGWLISMVWAPFGMVALARTADDLRAAEPAPAQPGWMGGAVLGLTGVFLAGTALAGWLAVVAVKAAAARFSGPGGLIERGVDADTRAALLAKLQGNATPEQEAKVRDLFMGIDASTGTATVFDPTAGGLR